MCPGDEPPAEVSAQADEMKQAFVNSAINDKLTPWCHFSFDSCGTVLGAESPSASEAK